MANICTIVATCTVIVATVVVAPTVVVAIQGMYNNMHARQRTRYACVNKERRGTRKKVNKCDIILGMQTFLFITLWSKSKDEYLLLDVLDIIYIGSSLYTVLGNT